VASGTASVSPSSTTVLVAVPDPTLAGAVVDIPLTTVAVGTPAPTAGGDGTTQVSPPATTSAVSTLVPTLGVDAWLIDNDYIGQVTGETRTPRTLSLTTRVQTDVLTSVLRPLKTDEGKVDVLATDDGGWTAVDRADANNSFIVTPPFRRQDLRTSGVYHVDRYEEDLVSQTVGEWDVSLDLVEDANRTDGDTGSPPADGAGFPWVFDQAFTRGEDAMWLLETPANTLVTDRVDAEFVGTGDGGVERFQLTVRLSFAQSRVFESELSRLAGGRIREIPDATNVAVDDTGGRATLGVAAPGGAVVPDGRYVIVEPWESRRLSEAFQELSVTIAST
jgi:hypothetical protein